MSPDKARARPYTKEDKQRNKEQNRQLQEKTEHLSLVTKNHSMQALGRITVGFFNAPDSQLNINYVVETRKKHGQLFTTTDATLNAQWNKVRQTSTLTVEQWAKQVTNSLFTQKSNVTNNELLKRLGFTYEKAPPIKFLSRRNMPKNPKQQVEDFLKGDRFKNRYLGEKPEEDGVKNLAEDITHNLKILNIDKKKDKGKIRNEVENIRKMIAKNDKFLGSVFGEEVKEAFKVRVDAEIAKELKVFDNYTNNIQNNDTSIKKFYITPVEEQEKSVLQNLETWKNEHKEKIANVWIQEAYTTHDRDKKIAANREATGIDPNNSQAWNNLGFELYKKGETENDRTKIQEAITAYDKA